MEGEYHRVLAHPWPHGIGKGRIVAVVQQRRVVGGGGNRRGRVPVIGGVEEVVGKFLGGVRRLGAGSIEGGEDRRGASHSEPEAAASALGGSGIPIGIEGRLGVREHERESGQLARGFTRVEDVRKWLPTVSRGH
jgi:hypothetical protein